MARTRPRNSSGSSAAGSGEPHTCSARWGRPSSRRFSRLLPELKERASWGVMHALEQIGPSAEPVLPLLLQAARHAEKRMRVAASAVSGG